MYKNIFEDKKYVEVYNASEAEKLGIGRNEKVALAMLLGGDYTDGVKGVGIVNGMEILQAFPVSSGIKEGLNAFKKWLDGFDLDDALGEESHSLESNTIDSKVLTFQKKHRSARSRWVAPKDFPANNVIQAYLKPVVDTSNEKFSWGIPDLTNIRSFCSQRLGWSHGKSVINSWRLQLYQ